MEENKETKKLTYEQLENVANQLSMQLNQAKQQINQMSSVLTKLPYLFKVVEVNAQKCVFSEDFVSNCAKEIEEIMNPKEEEVVENEKA